MKVVRGNRQLEDLDDALGPIPELTKE